MDVDCDFFTLIYLSLLFFLLSLLVVVQVVSIRYLGISSMNVFIPFDSSSGHLVALCFKEVRAEEKDKIE